MHNAQCIAEFAATSPADVKPEPTTMPAPEVMPEPKIIPEPEPDQVHEPATVSMPVDILVEYDGMEWSPVPLTTPDVNALNSAPLILFEEYEESTMPVSSPSTVIDGIDVPILPPTPTSSACSESA